MALCVLQLFSVPHDLCLGRQSTHRSALSQGKASGSLLVFLGIQGTGNYFEAIIAKYLPSFFHIPQQKKGKALSSHRYLVPIEVNGHKAFKYLEDSGGENLIAWFCLCRTLTTKVWSFLTPSILSSKLAQAALLSTQSCEHYTDSVIEILIPLKSMQQPIQQILKFTITSLRPNALKDDRHQTRKLVGVTCRS